MSHTPGPWYVMWSSKGKHSTNGAKILSKGAPSYFIGSVSPKADKPLDQKRCDANLIAAAPELLEALKALTDNVQDYEPWQRPCLALDNAKAAIARATGGAE